MSLMFLPHFDVFCDLLLKRRTPTWNIFVLYNNESFFISKSFKIARKPAFAHFGEHEKKPFDVIYYLYKMKQSHCLLFAAKNFDWPRKITPLSNLTRASSSVTRRGMKTYSESRIELQNIQILKKMLEKSSQFLSSEQPCEPKSLDAAFSIAGVEKIPPKNLRLRST